MSLFGISTSSDGANYPPTNYHFEVSIWLFPGVDCLFSEVSGIEMSREFERIDEGGNNGWVILLPGKVTYKDLELKRGIVPQSSPLFIWVEQSIKSTLLLPIVPMDINVKLLDENGNAQITWVFRNAIPKSLSVEKLDARNGAVLIESMTFGYSNFSRSYS
jgi:phage tail-like protein